jgi:intracellular sulfur oxidation DsrE/DsrF family protein
VLNFLYGKVRGATRVKHTIGIILSAVIFLATTGLSAAEERKVVFDLRSGDPARIEARLVEDIKYMTRHYRERNIEFKAVVVISGRAYKYFIEDLANSPYKDEVELIEVQNKFRPIFKELNDDYGVTFEMCEVGMSDRNIKPESLYSYVNSDKLQAVYLVDWQNAGYAYVPVN